MSGKLATIDALRTLAVIVPQRPHDTALGLARQRFIDSLPQKASEVQSAIALLRGSPESPALRDDVRARLQALFASAQVFRMKGLSDALQQGSARLDLARKESRPVASAELDALTRLSDTLPSLSDGPAPSVPPWSATAPPQPLAAPPQPVAPTTVVDTSSASAPVVALPKQPSERPSERVRMREHTSTLLGIQPPSAPPPASVPLSSKPPPAPLPLRFAPTVTAPDVPAASAPVDPVPAAVSSPIARVKVASRGGGLVELNSPASPTRSSTTDTRAADVRASTGTTQAAPALGYLAAPPPIVSALVCTDSASETLIRAALPLERFEILVAADTEEALKLTRSSAPDLILADAAVALGPDGLLARLRRDVIADIVPVVALFQPGSPVDAEALRREGAVDSLQKPLVAKSILRTVNYVADLGEAATWAPLGDLTVSDVADRIAAEVRRGLVLSTDRGPDVAVSLGDGGEVLAAAWAAVARVRAHLAERSGGRVHFRDPPWRRGPVLVSLNDLEPTAEEEARDSASEAEVSLRGRRVIVADDDPAVRWFFAHLLEDEGAEVVQAEDGVAALAAARAHPPDVIVSDILMPNMDGLSLCRALSHEPSVSETPVILLSWREDFLTRMRELRAGARGFLRKEAKTNQILASVREVLRGRAQFEARLRDGGAVRGRVDGLGIPTLLSTLLREREHALLTVRDAFHLFEVEIREHAIVSASCTASDGWFSRGDRALHILVGVSSGRFAIEDVDPSVRQPMAGGAPQVRVTQACERLGALIESVAGERLAFVHGVRFDHDALSSFRATAPSELSDVAGALLAGMSPRQLLLGKLHAQPVVEAALIDLARRGVIQEVHGESGEDLVASCVAARREALTPIQSGEASASHEMEADLDLPLTAPGVGAESITAEPMLLRTAGSANETPAAPARTKPEPLRSAPAARVRKGADTSTDTLVSGSTGEGRGLSGRDSFGPLTWLAVLFVLAAVGYVGYAMMLDSQRQDAEPSGSSTAYPTAAPATVADARLGDTASEVSAALGTPASEGAPREDGLSFGTQQPGVASVGVSVPAGHGVLHVLEARRPDVIVSIGDRNLGRPPQQIALPEGRHAVRYRVGDQVIDRYYFVREHHTRVVPVPES